MTKMEVKGRLALMKSKQVFEKYLKDKEMSFDEVLEPLKEFSKSVDVVDAEGDIFVTDLLKEFIQYVDERNKALEKEAHFWKGVVAGEFVGAGAVLAGFVIGALIVKK